MNKIILFFNCLILFSFGSQNYVLSIISCPNGLSFCPKGKSCCLVDSKTETYGCCPYEDAVCCTDMENCCPKNTICDVSKKACVISSTNRQNWHSIRLSSNQEENKPKSPNVCPHSKGTCSEYDTCCHMGGQQYGCCPLYNAVCCKGGKLCCPTGSACDFRNQKCILNNIHWKEIPFLSISPLPKGKTSEKDSESLKLTPFEKNNELKEKNTGDVSTMNRVFFTKCPDGKSLCSGDYTCCKRYDDTWGCCPFVNAICCPDNRHCCPKGFVCNSFDKSCEKQHSGVLNFLSQIPMKEKTKAMYFCEDKKSKCYSDEQCVFNLLTGYYDCEKQ